jgi:transposase
MLRKKVSRTPLFEFFAAHPPSPVTMDAGAGSHCLGRQLRSLGHTPNLLASHFVRPFAKSDKNDSIDAEAICEAAQRPSMRFVTPKSEDQQILSALRRGSVNLLLQSAYESLSQLHAFLPKVGVEAPRGPQTVERLPSLIETHCFSFEFTLVFGRLTAEFQLISTEM